MNNSHERIIVHSVMHYKELDYKVFVGPCPPVVVSSAAADVLFVGMVGFRASLRWFIRSYNH